MLDLFKALADQTRLRLLAILQLGEFTVQELVEILAMGQSRISRHLKILLAARIVQVKREGTWAYYRLQPSNPLFAQMQPILQPCWSELPGYSRDRTALAAILAARRNRSRAFFDRHAWQWDQMAGERLPVADYLPQLLVQIPPCSRLLEVGTGTGLLLEPLCANGRQVIAIDHSPAMLAAARTRVSTGGLESVALLLAQMEALPLAAASIDVAVMTMALHHAPDPLAVLVEQARVLRPGGSLFCCDLQRHQQEWVREQLADQWLGFTAEDLRSWCLTAGLQQIAITTISGRPEQLPVLIITAHKPVADRVRHA